MRPTPDAQSTDALRRYAQLCEFAARPAVLDSCPRQTVFPFQKKLTTSHWESAGVRHASGKCEPHPQRIPQKELEAMYLYVKWNRFWFSPTAGLLKHMLRISGHSVSFG